MARPNDPLYGLQTHLPRLGDLESIWDEATGRGVRVGIYSNGVDATNPDIAPNYDAGLHFRRAGTTWDASPLQDVFAGTAMAGLVGMAADNGIGGSGVAPDATLTGVDFLNRLQAQAQSLSPADGLAFLQAAIRWGTTFDVVLNGWGLEPRFAREQSLAEPRSISERVVYNNSFKHLVENGRDGKGTVIVHSPGTEDANANGDGLSASRFSITTAAYEDRGFHDSASPYGSNILVSAPLGSVTADLSGGAGLNRQGPIQGDLDDTDFTANFGTFGTVASIPNVAGVVALMLEANPDLGWRDVKTILAASAREPFEPYVDYVPTGNRDGWADMGGVHWNGGGALFSTSYGFGRLDAFGAVRMAEVWTTMTGRSATSANERSVGAADSTQRVVPLAQQDAQGSLVPGAVFVPFEISANIRVEHAALTVDLSAAYLSDVEIYLVSPTGALTTQLIHRGFRSDAPWDNDAATARWRWTFGDESFRGVEASGTWGVLVRNTGDLPGFEYVVLNSVRLDLYGAQGTRNDIYSFTEDFPTLLALQPGRGRLRDSDGGTDWINMAAVPGNVVADLGPNGLVRVGGENWFRLARGEATIENIVTGDGNDRIKGNALDNHIMGMRGNDRIEGRAGSDTLDGGSGNDTLLGGGGDDLLLGGAGNDRLFGGAGNDTLEGGGGNDRLVGGPGRDLLRGGPGKDTLIGGAGRDTLEGGAGADVLTGGPGADVFVFARIAHIGQGRNSDRITDFESGRDRIDLRGLELSFDGRGFSGDAGSIRFRSDGEDGRLAIDANGNGRANAVLILEGVTSFDPGDLWL